MATIVDEAERDHVVAKGQEILHQLTAAGFRPEDDGKFIAIDIDSSDFETDANDFQATERLIRRRPNVRMFLARVGRKAAYQFGYQSRIKLKH